MDPTVYYQKVRAQEAAIENEFPVVTSLATPDGGHAGLQTETPRSLAAKMIVNGEARLATQEEQRSFRTAQAEAKRAAEERLAVSQLHLSVVPTADLEKMMGAVEARSETEGSVRAAQRTRVGTVSKDKTE